MYYEIDYDSSPFPGVGKFVQKPEKIAAPKKDEIRERFTEMRDIARAQRGVYDISRFFDRRAQNVDASIFYKQGMFMKDFADSYEKSVPYSQYFPSYQMMGYEQLRTYFTWRAEVRKGNVADTSLSYAFLYIYELLGNIGVCCPQDGLDKLIAFWRAFSAHNNTIDRYVIRWLKDYFIYYGLPQPFKEFAEKNGLAGYYTKMKGAGGSFDLFCAISKYDIRKSAFFTDDTSKMIEECFAFVIERIRREFKDAGLRFDDALFRPTRKIAIWKPFKDAIFHPWLKQADRRVVLSENEIYACRKNEWAFSTVITTEKGRRFIGYVMKQMEADLRKLTKYKYKITANTGMIHEDTIRKLTKAGLYIERIVPAAVLEFYREATKTVVSVDFSSLARIRAEALVTQESLIVDEPGQAIFTDVSESGQALFTDSPEQVPVSDGWEGLREALSAGELLALSVILRGDDIKAFAEEHGIMPEVLIDGINEKAADYIGDSLLDEEFVLYDDYIEKVKDLVE